ncbi:hypothetical protein FLL45_12050 [Aliikangiella marina]|uniref:Uncharacterized protein n=1 Tax=Aliikangiella marina TaxID=1712262 RepID=A0A545T8R7_9GAMM|nr:hypothetical protein [Aliikangiella marina]TQV73599.1 hypothetical protein FLL45_12050 [Aliikangiella marina]
MKNNILTMSVFAFVTIFMGAQASAAAYVKYDGVDGESKDSKPTSKVRQLDKASPKAAGLLLPAVQKVRSSTIKPSKRKVTRKPAKSQSGKKKGNVEYVWKVEEGES